MKAVMISINTEWVYQILTGKKTVEVRKTVPKIKPPFKCYIYCTKDGKEPLSYSDYCGYDMKDFREDFLANGKVVAEFVCDRINPIPIYNGWMADVVDLQTTRLTVRELLEYAGGVDGKKIYGWHISNLKVYDLPKKLGEFFRECEGLYNTGMCWECECAVGEEHDCAANGHRFLNRPPQSWCYVEELR